MTRAVRAVRWDDDPRPVLATIVAMAWAIVAIVGPSLARADENAPVAMERAPRFALNDAAEPAPLPSLREAPSPERQRSAPEETSSLSDDETAWSDDEWLDDEFDLDDEFEALTADDPFERVNRGVFAFNGAVDRYMLTPVTDVYQTLVPTPGRQGIHNVFLNLDGPVRMTNAMLQGRPKASGIALARFIVNTTFGIGGLVDVGSRVGLPEQKADFGQTLARWGTPQGPYLVFPFLGPMTLRHGVGMGVDFVMQPVSYVVGPLPGMIVGAGKDFSRREQSVVELETLRDSSLDFYAALRSAFLQDRADLVASGQRDSRLQQMTSAGSDREAICLGDLHSRRSFSRGAALRAQATRRCAARLP